MMMGRITDNVFFISFALSVGLQFVYLFLKVDDIEGQLLDFLHQQAVHLAKVGTITFHLLSRGHAGQVAVKT
jgi:hypothetical protein